MEKVASWNAQKAQTYWQVCSQSIPSWFRE
jgi:hypothetical protein